MEKAIQNVIEAELQNDGKGDKNKKAPKQLWTNPLMATMAPISYKYGIALPFFYVEAASLM